MVVEIHISWMLQLQTFGTTARTCLKKKKKKQKNYVKTEGGERGGGGVGMRLSLELLPDICPRQSAISKPSDSKKESVSQILHCLNRIRRQAYPFRCPQVSVAGLISKIYPRNS